MTPGFDVENVLAELSIEEKAGLTSGANFWELKAVERLGVPRIILTDGPHGLRLQAGDAGDLTQSKNRPATCFPTATTLGSTWDPELVRRVGMALGRETRAAGVSVILGPGLNIKRHPLCGRNFEYIAEDPVISGHIGAALVQGIQSEGVGASPKHFACNSQETDRMRISAEVDERTLREIYFPAFEYVVRQAQPWTVMSAYNRVNGVFASENRWLLVEVLRDEWGFDGLVVSDWGAVGERPVSLAAGIDLEMPGTRGVSDAYLVREIAAGRAAEAALNQATARVLRLISRGLPALNDPGEPNHAAHHRLAREVAAAGTVLLRNEPVGAAPLLPLASGTKVAVIGEFARTPRYQGAGSSMVNPTRLESLLDGLAELGETVAFAPGYTLELDDGGTSDEVTLRDEAVAAARQAEVAVVFVGLPLEREAEGRDRDDISLPAAQVALVEAVAAAQPRTVVVVAGGSVVELPWRTQVPAIMEMWLAGQAGGPALADLLYGHQVPGGRLAETIPLRLQHTPAYGNFPGEGGKVRYGEGVLVGYRWYDYRDIPVAYPFGHGLTYTTFDYSDAVATVSGDGDNTEVSVTVNVSNTG
ncbi:MAG: glycoside hydrolase family 3 C-terminal domain-containing protein, partial [Propionibacteriaceae bacterium]|nr:glycoside hydrolase family 3 C-terminal domain-containing protein [Propionibacteriaceae bacterium]